MYRVITTMNINNVNAVLKEVGISGDLLARINIKLKQIKPDIPMVVSEVIGAQYSEDDEDDMPILPPPMYQSDDDDDMPIIQPKRNVHVNWVKTWKLRFNKVDAHINKRRYLIRDAKYHQVKLRYRREFKELMKQNGIKTIKDMKSFGRTLGVSYTMRYKKDECLRAYEQHMMICSNNERCPNIEYYHKTWQ